MARKSAKPSPVNLPADQPFSGLEAGSLLHDFEMLLRAIEPGMPVSDHNGMPAGQTLLQLDAKLRRPMNLQLARFSLRFHPYLQGLYLLAQACNFTSVEGKTLRLNPDVKASWDELNDTERYFNLLEAAFVHAEPDLIGQRGSFYDLHRIPEHVVRLPNEGLVVDLKATPSHPWDLGFGEVMNLALADLFGFVTVEFPTQPVKPWRPAAIRATAWGRAIAPILLPRLALEMDNFASMLLDAMLPRREADWGVFQPIFSKVYPAYKRVLVTAPAVSLREGVYVFKVSLGSVWRRIAFPDEYTLYGVLIEVLKAFRFDNDHLHAFRFRDRGGRRHNISSPECADDGPASDDVALAELPIDPGMAMELEFDFGDSWRFTVKLEKVEPVGAIRGKLPRVLEKEGKAPEQYPRWD
jgi:hypothetical protein